MSNRERTGLRDMTISGWHRVAFDNDAVAFDLDLVGLCKRCRAHLYVIEASRDSEKVTTWTALTANRLNVPGYLVWYVETDAYHQVQMRVWQVSPPNGEPEGRLIGDREAFECHVRSLRRAHDYFWHGRDYP